MCVQYNFEGNYDLVKYIKLIAEKGMYVTLRVGPFIQAEWNHGYWFTISHMLQYFCYFSLRFYFLCKFRGLPYWLREKPNIIFRSDNPPFKVNYNRHLYEIVSEIKVLKLIISFAALHEKICIDDRRHDEGK